MADIFLPLLTLSECVFPIHEQHNHGWHVSATFDSQEVRISIPWAAQSWLTCFCHFDSQEVRISIPWAAQSWLTCSCHFWLSASAYFHTMSSTIMADMFPPLLTLSKCVFPYHEQHNYGWHDPTTFDSQMVCMSISWAATIMADMSPPLSIIRKCVISFYSRHHQRWLVPSIFDSQWVRISTSWTAQLCLTCSHHFCLSGGVYFQSMSYTITVDISHHFWLSVGVYVLYMSGTIMADMFLLLSIIRMCVIPFHLQHHQGWLVPVTFNSQRVCMSNSLSAQLWLTCSCHPFFFWPSQVVRISIPWAASSRLTCSHHFWLSAGA